MIGVEIPPAWVLWGGVVLLPLLPRSLRPAACCLLPAAALALVLALPVGASLRLAFGPYELAVLEFTRLGRVFAIIFALIALLGGIYSLHLREAGQQGAALLYAGGALGVACCGDLFTLLFCWEVMTAGSTWLIWASRDRESRAAGMRYLLYHLLGGGLLLSGILLQLRETGSLALAAFPPGASSPAAWLILTGVVINAAMVPLHTWLPDSYPRATVTGAVFLSAFTTKAAVYVLAVLFPGWPVLLVMGTLMTVYGVTYAFLANDIREILSYHIVSQVGYMVAGVGIGTELALNGSAAHAYSHILYKALLFMGAGAVLQATGTGKLHRLGGLYPELRGVFAYYMVGALSISGAPLFNGFISKSIIVYAAHEGGHGLAHLFLLLAGVGTFLSVGVKLPYFTWFHEKKESLPRRPLPRGMKAAMALTSLLCVGYGIFPDALYQELPFAMAYRPYTPLHLAEALQILVFTFLAFWWVRAKLIPHEGISLDTDWCFRAPAPLVRRIAVDGVNAAFDAADRFAFALARRIAELSVHPLAALRSLGRPERAFDPHADRPPLGLPIGLTLLVTVAAAFWLLSL